MKLTLSVCIISYNHEKYIKEAIEGVLNQETNFPFEIVVGDDASTDKTIQILKKLQTKYPKRLKVLNRKTNLGMIKNFKNTYQQCKGKYVAILEGDDYWTDKQKLQKQVNFLEAHPKYMLSGHAVNIYNEKTKTLKKFPKKTLPQKITLADTLSFGTLAPTCSLVVRRTSIEKFPIWFDKAHSADWAFHILPLKNGFMKFHNEIMGVYRRHEAGSLHAAKQEAKKNKSDTFALPAKYCLATCDDLENYFPDYRNLIAKSKTYWYYYYLIEYTKINDWPGARKYANKLLPRLLDLSLWEYTSPYGWINAQKMLSIFKPYTKII